MSGDVVDVALVVALVVRVVSAVVSAVVVAPGTVVNPFVVPGCTVVVTVVAWNPGHNVSTKPPDSTIPSNDPELTLRSPHASFILSAVSSSPCTQLTEHCFPFVKSFLVQPSISLWYARIQRFGI